MSPLWASEDLGRFAVKSRLRQPSDEVFGLRESDLKQGRTLDGGEQLTAREILFLSGMPHFICVFGREVNRKTLSGGVERSKRRDSSQHVEILKGQSMH